MTGASRNSRASVFTCFFTTQTPSPRKMSLASWVWGEMIHEQRYEAHAWCLTLQEFKDMSEQVPKCQGWLQSNLRFGKCGEKQRNFWIFPVRSPRNSLSILFLLVLKWKFDKFCTWIFLTFRCCIQTPGFEMVAKPQLTPTGGFLAWSLRDPSGPTKNGKVLNPSPHVGFEHRRHGNSNSTYLNRTNSLDWIRS